MPNQTLALFLHPEYVGLILHKYAYYLARHTVRQASKHDAAEQKL